MEKGRFMDKNNKKWFWIILGIASFVIFFHLGSIPLLDPDEPVYAETAKEMLVSGDFVSPRIYGDFWYDKPPLYYWLTAASFKLWGVSEFAARFPAALCGVASVMLVYRCGCRFFGLRAGIAGALALTTSIEYFYVAKAAVTDSTLTFFMTAALLLFLEKKYLLFYLCAALATLTKGPIGLVFPGSIIFLYLLATKNFRELKRLKLPQGMLLFAVVALPWYVAMYQLHGTAFLDTFIGYHNITRFTTAEHSSTAAWYFFMLVFAVGFFPWTALLAQAVYAALAKRSEQSRELLFLSIWAAFIFIFFSLSSTKLVTYILPMYPAAALLVGWYVGNCLEEPSFQGWRRYLWPSVLSGMSLCFLGGAYYGSQVMPELTEGLGWLAFLWAAMTGAVWYAARKQKPCVGFWGQVAAMAMVAVVFVGALVPAVAPAFTSRYVASEFEAVYDGQEPVYIAKFLHPGFTFYTDVYGKEVVSKEELQKALAKEERAYYVLRQGDYEALAAGERAKLCVLLQSGKILLLQQQGKAVNALME